MEKETFIKAKQLLDDISRMKEIRNAMKEEADHWWAFVSPDTKRFDGSGLPFPKSFRKDFSVAVEAAIAKMEKELEEL